jgi:hypothetical protein
MTNIYAASAQWASRPDDQRFDSLDALQDATNYSREMSTSAVMSTRSLEAGVVDDEIVVRGVGADPLKLTHYSFGQMAARTKTPASYLRELPAPMAADLLEFGMKFRGDVEDRKFLYTPEVMRATTGPNYGRIWDSQIVAAVRQMNERSGNIWTVPSEFNRTEGFTVTKANTTLYASDHDMFAFLVDETRPIDIDGQTYFRGFYTWNSEVGDRTFGLNSFIYSYVCCNRIIWGARDIEELRIRHTSLAPDRFIEEAQPALKALAEGSPEPIVTAIKSAKETYVGKTVSDVEKWLARKGFGTFESKVAMQLAAQGGDTGSSGNPSNLWDLINGGTAAARSVGHQDARLDAEKRWSGLLSYAGKGQD